MAVTRLITLDDAETFARLLTANRDYLAPWSPLQNDRYFTEDGHREVLARDLAAQERGGMLPLAILDADGAVCGRINLNSIIRGAFQGASVGYWVSESRAGRSLASAAVADVVGIGFGNSACTALKRRRYCTTRRRNECSHATAFGRSRSPRRTSRSPGVGRIMSCINSLTRSNLP
jgi:RimJ/RimL family protein N-acetyltransferase